MSGHNSKIPQKNKFDGVTLKTDIATKTVSTSATQMIIRLMLKLRFIT